MSAMPTMRSKLKSSDGTSRAALWVALSVAAFAVTGALYLLAVRGDTIVIDLASGWAAIAACF